MRKRNIFRRACSVVVFCVAATVMSSAQRYTVLDNFDQKDGAAPQVGMIQGLDGDLYGTTPTGGPGSSSCGTQGCGTVFKVSRAGNLATLYTFCSQPDCEDGALPDSSLALAPNGNFYGTTLSGGPISNSCGDGGCGTIFDISPTGDLTVLHGFCSEPSCADGAGPRAGLVF